MGRSAGSWVVAILVLGMVMGCATDATDSPPAIAQQTPDGAPPGPSGANPSGPVAAEVEVRGQAGSVVHVAVVDESGGLTVARSASLAEISQHETDFVGRNPIIGRNIGDERVLVLWTGSSCDPSGWLVIGLNVVSIRYLPDRRPGCDAITIVRGVVLDFDRAVVASGVVLSVGPEQIIE